MQTIRQYSETLFRASLILYTVGTGLLNTEYTIYAPAQRLFVYFRYGAFALLAVLALYELYCDFLCREDRRHGVLFLLTALVAGISAFRADDRTVVFVILFVFTARRGYLKKALMTSMVTQAVLLGVTAAGSMTGLIPDLMIKRTDIPIRHSLGYTYPSVCMSCVIFLLFLYLWNYGEILTGRDFFFLEVINVLFFLLTDARLGFVTGTAAILTALLLRRWEISTLYINPLPQPLFDHAAAVVSSIYAVLCLISLAVPHSFIDKVLSERLRYTKAAVARYGVHFFPEKINWVGFGGTENTDALLSSYNFVDCSYANILLSYGIPVFFLLLMYMALSQKRIRQTEPLFRRCIILFVLLYCMLEPSLMQLQINVFLLLGAPALRHKPLIKKETV